MYLSPKKLYDIHIYHVFKAFKRFFIRDIRSFSILLQNDNYFKDFSKKNQIKFYGREISLTFA